MSDAPKPDIAAQLLELYPELPTPTSIRLLVIAPWASSTPEDGSGAGFTPAGMTVVDLEDSDLDFAALSCVWGGTKDNALFTGDMLYMEVTKNLALALKDMRIRIDEPIRIWVDALCINQSNMKERSSQVAMMFRIYSAASRVVVHLGHAADNSDSIPDILRALSAGYQHFNETQNSLDEVRDNSGLVDLSAIGLPDFNSHEWETLQTFFLRPWFHRSWTLQEVQAASEAVFICEGWPEALPLWLFSQALAAIQTFQPPCLIKSGVEARLYRFLETPPLLYVLYANRTDGCGDPRDAIYAYLGVSAEANDKALLPNYEQGVGFVYHKFAEHFVQSGQGMEMLYNCCISEDQPDVPSWVPKWNSIDWSRTTRRPSFLDVEASARTEMRIGTDTDMLTVKGVIIDFIELVSNARPSASPQMLHVTELCKEILGYVTEIEYMLSRRTSSTKVPYEDITLATWKTLAAESSETEGFVTQALEDPDFLAFFKNFIPFVEVHDGMHVFPEDRIGPFEERFAKLFPLSVSFSAEVYTRCSARRSCITTLGYLGNADPMSQPKDAIALIKGALHPFILRPVQLENGDKRYRFVGHVYLTGLENGEAWPWPDVASTDLYLV